MSTDAPGLDVLLPVVARWFRETFGAPTPPQEMGWPAIAAGRNALIFAPTGSGKTLAAFLACLDHLWRNPPRAKGCRVLYVSPLKALNQDIARNLRLPLDGILATAEAEGSPLPPLTVGLRSGDTPAADRQRMVRKPPDILITTPESLHLLLTSRARETLRSVSHVIVDEIHALCPNKRGAFLALLLERLEAISDRGFVRIGLSATQRPLEEVARYLGGARRVTEGPGPARYEPRPVTVVDTGQRKVMDLEVVAGYAAPGKVPGASVWPAIEGLVFDYVRDHRSTIVFANNRRLAERLTSRLNALALDDREAADAGGEDAPDLARSHHGSLSLEERRETEEALKRGDLPAVVATASLEMGIDMGAVDLVCQLESPGSVSRGLQRVGRAGHLVGRVSKGRLIAKTAADLLESAALCREMTHGRVETLRVPTNCLDVLAQQVVACVAVDRWEVGALFDLVRQAYPYRDLPAEAFEGVLKMVSGRFPVGNFRDLQARVGWDRVHNQLAPLPGTLRLAVTGGGTIPDTGTYPVYLGEGGPRLGELDEEFVLEQRVGQAFVLGTATWTIEAIEPQKVIVGRAEGRAALMPFWRGEDAPRTPELGEAVGAVTREVAARLDDPALPAWLRDECRLDDRAAEALRRHVGRQVRAAGAAPDDRTVLVETFKDPAGETGLAVLTPFGGKLHLALKLVLQGRFRERFGVEASSFHGDDGLLIRLPNADGPPLDLFDGLTPEAAGRMLREELGDSALFGLRFRQNAGRALLMPRPDPSKRTPLWLQRLRARDLLQVVRKFPDFPVVVETYRECLNDDLDLPRLNAFLEGIQTGRIRVITRQGETPSPFASELIFRFEHHFLYQWDEPEKRGPRDGASAVDDAMLDPLLDPSLQGRWLDPAAVGRVESRLRGVGRPPRTAEEMAEALRSLGDLAESDLAGPMRGFAEALETDGRAVRIELAGTAEPLRWVLAEEAGVYDRAFRQDGPSDALETIVARFCRNHALVGLHELRARYPIDPALATDLLERLTDHWGLVRLDAADGDGEAVWADPANLAEVRRLSIALKRRESVAVAPEVFADFLVRRHGLHPDARREGPEAVGPALELLQGYPAPFALWEANLLPARVVGYRPPWLDEELDASGWTWRGQGDGRSEPKVAFLPADFLPFAPPPQEGAPSADAATVRDALGRQGASFAADVARQTGLEPSRARRALDELVGLGLVTNDRLGPLRSGNQAVGEALAAASASRRHGLGRPRHAPRRVAPGRAEGRWSLLPSAPGGEGDGGADGLLSWAGALLGRYGVLSRETAAADPWAPPWRDLAAVLAKAELRGEVRRGYFVEGLSGVQYASAEAAEGLARLAATGQATGPPVLLATLDPANPYGSGAPLDVPLLEGGTARLSRTVANDLVLCAGRPVLIIEGAGRRLTGLGSASEDELRAAVALLPRLAGPHRRALKVETYNNAAALASPAAPWLAAAGFVRDHPGMTYYAPW